MTTALLASELHTDPVGIGYAVNIPDKPGWLVNQINAPTRSMIREKYITVRSLMAYLGLTGALIAEKLESFSNQAPLGDPQLEGLRIATKWAMRFINSDGQGLDIGNATTQGMIDGLVAATVLTAAEGDALKAIAVQPASRAEELFGIGTYITEKQIQLALAS